MCSRKSQGTHYDRCGHYEPTAFYDYRDCKWEFCQRSSAHNPLCQPPNCQCDYDWDPDHGQTITERNPGACEGCAAYFASNQRRKA
ncbi:hypothetical protein BKA62DRAFT_820720 [Auriculariales sp. MPI-PUGE-AT-0066]|nr:hypothetical protein BKA62DRAFT_820720 [Auriculariales sp. MPI-PUGE-AT-0066]